MCHFQALLSRWDQNGLKEHEQCCPGSIDKAECPCPILADISGRLRIHEVVHYACPVSKVGPNRRKIYSFLQLPSGPNRVIDIIQQPKDCKRHPSNLLRKYEDHTCPRLSQIVQKKVPHQTKPRNQPGHRPKHNQSVTIMQIVPLNQPIRYIKWPNLYAI